MARLLGATGTITLPRTGIRLNLRTERLSHVDGRSRETFLPRILVPPSVDPERDDPLERALHLLVLLSASIDRE